jgi:hypothetical protein
MNQMKTSWNHPEKKRALIWFLVVCFITLDFAFLEFLCPELRTKSDLCYVMGFAAFACFWGYRAFFHSDEWYRAREEKWKFFWNKYPRLEIVTGILFVTVFIVFQIWFTFFRHR